MSIRAIFFDLFETLITEFADGKRISNRQYDYMRLLGLSHADFKLEWHKHHDARMRGEFATFPEVIQAMVTSRSLLVDEKNIDSLYQDRVQEKQMPFKQIHSEVLEMLRDLKNNSFRIGLISNCTEEEVRGWRDSALGEYFDDVIFSYQVGMCKPDKDIYTLACNRLSVGPDECIFVGDGGSDELPGAAAAGLHVVHAVWFHSSIKSDFMKIDSPSKLIAAIEQMQQLAERDTDSTTPA
ncbi:putative hydrolase of the HAD superfamily [Paenibacillus cellulosilyticus]|uniref:Putative hydrolase of the HAD superfamily n=1 Tax=Paenibacillus cellulosilyticus TaxID=375489 RepID=A0A2V2YLH3_9BACL|nr:HAD-IA family hydrolase [Paenibacillus cellulosilyticus]PWV94490.1 putative hydrolase of the HAD superfamily [Paenibacillus cellulosilyticus]QKS45002.1 HAD-IA family hydrolase [Paenibacillus cellulosilyticus]